MSFFDDPKGFCKTNNVKVIGGEIVPDDRAFTRLSAPRCYQLKDDKKISKGAITDSNPPGLKELRVGTNGTLLYFLPWSEGCGYRVTLSPSGGFDSALFVTAELNGCTVIVDGPPETPTVYHFNAKEVGGSLGGLSSAEEDPRLKTCITAKVADMENRFKICRAQSPVPGTTPRAGSARGVNLTHYMGPVVDVATYRTYFDKIKSKRDFGFDPDAAPIMSRRNPNEVHLDPSTLAFSATASVMGIRKNNAWKFYCHYKWSAIYQKQKPDTAGTTANDWELQTPIIASGIFEFSPATGHGIAL
jgi:hypothetical protein